jgi:hypothetical protein
MRCFSFLFFIAEISRRENAGALALVGHFQAYGKSGFTL